MPRAATHPSPAELAAFASGRLSPEDQAALEEHISACDLCCRHLAEAPDDTLLVALRGAGTKAGYDSPVADTASVGRDAGSVPHEKPVRPTIPPELIDHPRYRVEQLLGSGGMGDVFKAEHRMMQRPVALKVIRQKLTSNPAALERFQLEVRAAAKLLHPNIVAAHDADQAGDLHFLVMEYVDGISLDRYVQHHGRMKVDEAVRVARLMATALQHAHELQMVHRDIKPQNVMVTRKSQVKILDFGLAKFFREQQDIQPLNAGMPSHPDLTTDGLILGTPDYIAPEQVTNSKGADIRADIYSLGCTLYYMLAGQPPFATGTSVDKMLAHTREQATPLSQLRDDVSPELSAIVERMMAKRPSERFQEPKEVAKALQPFVKSGGANVVVASPQDLQPLSPLDLLAPDVLQQAPAITISLPRPKRQSFRLDQPPLLIGAVSAAGLVLLVLIGSLASGCFGRSSGNANQANAGKGNGAQSNATPKPIPAVATPTANGNRILYIVPQNGIWWPDYAPVRTRLENAGFIVEVASSSKGTCYGTENESVKPEFAIQDADISSFDAIVFGGKDVKDLCAGGSAGDATLKLIKDAHDKKRIIAAICTGQYVLVSHRALNGKKAARLLEINQPNLPANKIHVDWQDQAVVRADNFITARGPQDAPEFTEAIIAALSRR